MNQKEHNDIYDYMYWGDYNARIKELASKAIPETWSFPNKNDYSILKNYLKYTFLKLQEENKILETDTHYIFNTGLFTSYYEPIFVQCEKDPTQDSGKKFNCFCTNYELGYLGIHNFPERANYFSDPSLLVFDWRCNININYRHILEDEDNKIRLPEYVTKSDRPEWELEGSVNNAIKRVTANYKLAVPQYFKGNIQLLLPLCFGKTDKPYLALALTKMKGQYYLGHTCLTLEMAYNNARLISKPDSNWLLPQEIC